MENKKGYAIIAIVAIICAIVLVVFYPREKVYDQPLSINNTMPDEPVNEKNLGEVKVTGYHLVTYAQSANSNSLIQSLTVNAATNSKIRFAIGTIDSNSVPQERTSFEVECTKGENTIDLSKQRHFLKQGEYLFMDISGQDTLYTQKETTSKIYVQSENNKVSGKMIMTESNYILPFKYTLSKIENFNTLVIGNEITTQNDGKGLNATEENLDYYHITKTRLENTFDKVKMNAINATTWEKGEENRTRKVWLVDFLKKDMLTNLDLVIFQLGDHYTGENNLENDMKDLVEHIRQYSPNAQMLWLGVWGQNETMQNRLPGICERLHLEYINIRDLNVPDYQSLVTENVDGIAKEVYYPNNEAMQIISNRIVEVLGYTQEIQ